MSHPRERLENIKSALLRLGTDDLRSAGAALFATLGYESPKTLDTGGDPAVLLDAINVDPMRFDLFGGISRWRSLDVMFQVTGDELPALARGSVPRTHDEYQSRTIDSFVFLALDLHEGLWTRRQLVGISRELNRGFGMPAIVLFRHDRHATLSVIDRRQNQRDPTRDVIGGQISLIKDINLASPHRAHQEILADLTFNQLRPAPSDFRLLYDAWLEVLSATELNKRFYNQLADWFAWASSEGVVHFPPGQGNGDGERQIGLIRLLTRLMFVWFIKQKRLVPDELFDSTSLSELLTEGPKDNPDAHGYYLSILQNLFFACLNTEMSDRGWLSRDVSGRTDEYLVHTKLRQQSMFADPDAALNLFASVPFLNGGLFECLDVVVQPGDSRYGKAERESRRGDDLRVLRVDGFSETPARQPRIPNRLFFGGQENADLSHYFGVATRRTVPGLIDLFERYKFTVEENTPLEQEAALDPELLGKVFENLLASYNEDTRTTARNKSGSFYTPREVVNFMVDEALVAYLLPVLCQTPDAGLRSQAPGFDFGHGPGELALEPAIRSAQPVPPTSADEDRLRSLLSYAGDLPIFTEREVESLIRKIEECRAIDPAVGSGAFPLGLLQKLVHVLHRLDPQGGRWKARNRLPLENALEEMRRTVALAERADRIADAEAKLKAFDESFDVGTADYARKLYLIERCLHGVDIQPVAVQIAKLRCFIALAVEQVVDDGKPNRGITALPNLEMKFVAANSLGLIHEAQGQLRDLRINDILQQMRDANADLFTARNWRSKKRARNRIHALRENLGTLLANGHVYSAEEADLIAQWDPFDANSTAGFFDPEWMFGLTPDASGGCFDIVLANPPYVRQGKIDTALKAKLREYETFTGTADLLVFFYERSIRLLKSGGALAFITSSKWYRAAYGARLRRWLNEQTRLRSIIDFGDADVFDAVAYPTILVATRRAARQTIPVSSETFRALNWKPDEPSDGFPERFAHQAFEMPQSALLTSGWQLEPQIMRDLLARLRMAGTPLGEWCGKRFYRGILTGLNEAFVIDGAKRAELIDSDPACEEIIKPFLRGRDIKRWQVEPADQWLIKIPSSENIGHPWTGRRNSEAETIFANCYPSIYRWWTAENLRQRLIDRHDQGHYFWELRSCAYWSDFESPKIIVAAIVGRAEAAPDFEGRFSNNKSTIYVTPSVQIALSVVNSSIADWFARQTFAEKQGGFLDFEPRYSGTIPIPHFVTEQEALASIVVDSILAGAHPRAHLESLINAFVYELFFPEEFMMRGISAFAAARDAGLMTLRQFAGATLAQQAGEWSRVLVDPGHPLYNTLFAIQAIDAVRVIEGR